jgi:uroporphyrinogen decarboxylase
MRCRKRHRQHHFFFYGNALCLPHRARESIAHLRISLIRALRAIIPYDVLLMNKIQRFHAAVRGEAVDYPPAVAWCNLATDALDGAENARRQLAFYRACDWDICKVMNDYRLAPPAGIDTIASPDDMLRFAKQAMSERVFAEQIRCLRIMRAQLGPEVPLIDTLFEPFFSLLFAVGFSRAAFIRSHANAATSMLTALTETFVDYIAEIRNIPVDGVIYATNACILPPAARGISDAEFHDFHEPYDHRLLGAMEGLVRIVHAHGNPLDLSRILDYPCEVFSWSDRLAGNPPIAAVRPLTTKCLMGGIDESKLHERSLPEIRAEVADALAQAGGTRNFILAPGCNVSSGIAQRLLLGFRDAPRAGALRG